MLTHTQNNNYDMKYIILLLLLHEDGIVFDNAFIIVNVGTETEKISAVHGPFLR